AGVALARGDIAHERDVAPLEPEAVALMSEVLDGLARLDPLAGAPRVDGDVLDKRADPVPRLGHLRRTRGGIEHVVRTDHIAAVSDDAPARAVDHGAIVDGYGLVFGVGSGPVEVDGIPAARIQPGPGDLRLVQGDVLRLAATVEDRIAAGIEHGE